MKTCDNCKIVYRSDQKKCDVCGAIVAEPILTDEYLKKFLEVDGAMLDRFKEVRLAAIEEAKMLGRKKDKLVAIGISGSARDQFDMAAESSNSEFLLQAALKSLEKEGVETELIPLRKYSIKPCKACYSTTNTQCHFRCSCYPKDTAAADDMSNVLYDKVLSADIILFASPVNNFKMSSLMALFLDRCISLDGSLAPANPQAAKNKELNIKHTKFVELMADQNIPGSGFLRRFAGKVGGFIVTGHEEGAGMVMSSWYMTFSHFGMAFAPWSNMYAMSSNANPTYKDKSIVTSEEYQRDAVIVAKNALRLARAIEGQAGEWQYDYSSN